MSKRVGFRFGPDPDPASDPTPDGPGPGGIEVGPVFNLPTGELVRMTADAFALSVAGPGPVVFTQALAAHFEGVRADPPGPLAVCKSLIQPPGHPELGLVFFTLADEPNAVTVVTAVELARADAAGIPGGVN